MLTLLYHVLLLTLGKPSGDYSSFMNMRYVLYLLIQHKMHRLIYFPFGSRASNYGLVRFDDTGCVLQFLEKPRDDDIESMVSIALSTQIHFFSFIL
jgi:ADP-glucose pyrophosphorylase